MKSEKLRIRVTEGDRTKVDLIFGARITENLPELIPDDLRPKLEQRAIDVSKIARDAVTGHFEAGELFQLSEGGKTISVWLE